MTPSNNPIEKTAAGLQCVILGAERVPRPRQTIPKAEGAQYIIPGAERISTAEHVARLIDKPLRPRRRQVGLHGTSLFGMAG
jgi:hypothetical protein